MSKKVFLVGKVHEVEPATIMIVQFGIQCDLDRLTFQKMKLSSRSAALHCRNL